MEKKFVALILEQEPLQRDLMGLVLQNLSCEVLTTIDVVEARHLLRTRQPHLLVVDTSLPNTNGLELIKKFQAVHLLEKTHVMVISTMGFEEIVRQAAKLGIGAYLVKPIDAEIFSERAKSLLVHPHPSA
jgi:two-component system OmpR family response regulator